MEYRELGRTGWKVSAISFGAWAIGGTWGTVSDQESLAALHQALRRSVIGVMDISAAALLPSAVRSPPVRFPEYSGALEARMRSGWPSG